MDPTHSTYTQSTNTNQLGWKREEIVDFLIALNLGYTSNIPPLFMRKDRP